MGARGFLHLVCASACVASLACAAQPAIDIEPGSVVLDGEPVHLVLRGIPPRSEVTVTAERWFAPLAVGRSAPRRMNRRIVESRKASGLETEAMIFPNVGHLLYDTGYSPTTQYNSGLRKTGGTPEANARAQAKVWTQTIEFLRRSLGVNPGNSVPGHHIHGVGPDHDSAKRAAQLRQNFPSPATE
jgi:hypothetical protein